MGCCFSPQIGSYGSNKNKSIPLLSADQMAMDHRTSHPETQSTSSYSEFSEQYMSHTNPKHSAQSTLLVHESSKGTFTINAIANSTNTNPSTLESSSDSEKTPPPPPPPRTESMKQTFGLKTPDHNPVPVSPTYVSMDSLDVIQQHFAKTGTLPPSISSPDTAFPRHTPDIPSMIAELPVMNGNECYDGSDDDEYEYYYQDEQTTEP
eukprot:146810_1